MFDINGWEMIGLVLLALFVFGPERLPKVIGDAANMLRKVRSMARNATTDLSRELGTEVRLEDLRPRTFVRRHLLSEEDEDLLRRPVDDIQQDLRRIAAQFNDDPSPYPRSRPAGIDAADDGYPPPQPHSALPSSRDGVQTRFDDNAT